MLVALSERRSNGSNKTTVVIEAGIIEETMDVTGITGETTGITGEETESIEVINS